MQVLLARSAMHAHAWQDDNSSTDSQDSTMSVGTDGTTLPQLALPLQSRRFLVMNRMHLWFHYHEHSFVLHSTLPALLGAPRTASSTLSCLHWRAWNTMHRTCREAHRCMRFIWRVTPSEEAALAQYAEARLLVIEHYAYRTRFALRLLCLRLSQLASGLCPRAAARRHPPQVGSACLRPFASRLLALVQAEPPVRRAVAWMAEAAFANSIAA